MVRLVCFVPGITLTSWRITFKKYNNNLKNPFRELKQFPLETIISTDGLLKSMTFADNH